MPGLRHEVRLSGAETERWGAVLLWESDEAARQPPPGRALELTRRRPALRRTSDVEATVEGESGTAPSGCRSAI